MVLATELPPSEYVGVAASHEELARLFEQVMGASVRFRHLSVVSGEPRTVRLLFAAPAARHESVSVGIPLDARDAAWEFFKPSYLENGPRFNPSEPPPYMKKGWKVCRHSNNGNTFLSVWAEWVPTTPEGKDWIPIEL